MYGYRLTHLNSLNSLFSLSSGVMSSFTRHYLINQSVRHIGTNGTRFFSKITAPNTITIRKMDNNDMVLLTNWAIREGWNPGLHESSSFFAADPSGYHLLEVNHKPVASLASVRYSSEFAFLGLYIVDPQHRGQGYGKFLWDNGLNYLNGCSAIGLNGVAEQVQQYKKEGFVIANTNTRWQGNLFFSKRAMINQDKSIVISKPTSISAIIDYDINVFPVPRVSFLTKWLAMPESNVLIATNQGKICGYGVISKTSNGHKIAPLYADNHLIAEQLYKGLCATVADPGLVHIDTSAANPSAATLAQRFGLQKTFDTFRMYRGNARPIDEHKCYGLTSLEIG
ncbi:MAG: GNAT family N-acetyltransferase [Legionella sp.]